MKLIAPRIVAEITRNIIKIPNKENTTPKIANHIPSILFFFIAKIAIAPKINPTIGTRKNKKLLKIIVEIAEFIVLLTGTIHKRDGINEIIPRIKLVIASLLFMSD